jgi:hypothetical protein
MGSLNARSAGARNHHLHCDAAGYNQAGHRTVGRELKANGEVISLRRAVPAVLVAAGLAGCITYFVNPPPRAEADQRLPPSLPPTNIDQHPSGQEHAAAAFERAAAAIIRRAAYAEASASGPPTTGHIPLPKRRPLPRP